MHADIHVCISVQTYISLSVLGGRILVECRFYLLESFIVTGQITHVAAEIRFLLGQSHFSKGVALEVEIELVETDHLQPLRSIFAGSDATTQPTSRLPTRAFSSRILFSAWCRRLRWEWMQTLHCNGLEMLGNYLKLFWNLF